MRFSLACLVAGLAIPFASCGADTPTAPDVAAPVAMTPAPPPPSLPPSQDRWSVSVDGSSSKITWTAMKNGGTPVSGTLSVVDGGLAVTPADLGTTDGALKVDLSHVDSGDALRDQRLIETFFGSNQDDGASAKVEVVEVNVEPKAIEIGQTARGTARFALLMKQGKVDGVAKIAIERPDPNRWHVTTSEPALLSVASLGLGPNLAALIQACGHKSVEDGVNVSLDLLFGPKVEGAGASSNVMSGRSAPGAEKEPPTAKP